MTAFDPHLIEPAILSAGQRDEMFALMHQYYANMDRAAFDRDLDEKRWVIYLSSPDTGRLCGFSTQTLLEVTVDSRPVRALYSGDTIMDQQHRASTALTRWWGRLALSLIDAHGGEDLYWFLISKGYKTYRFLPVFFNAFYPRFDVPTPPGVLRIVDALSTQKFPFNFDSARGIIRAQEGGCRLREGVAEISEQRLTDPHVRFFVEMNPGHAKGDELCCLAPLTRENFKAAAYRAIGSEDVSFTVPP
jgi:hypothetical protein